MLIALGVVFASAPAAATEPAAEQSALLGHRIEFLATPYYFDYRELVAPPLKSREKGVVPGFALAWRWAHEVVVLGLRADLAFFDVTYDGSLQDGTPLVDESSFKWIAGELIAGGRLEQLFGLDPRQVMLALYGGIAYQQWRRGLGGPSPFDENYHWFHVPVGLDAALAVHDEVVLGFDVALLLMFGGFIVFELSDSDPRFNDPETDLGNEPGVRVRLSAAWSVLPWLELVVRPFYVYTAIAASEPVGVYAEGRLVQAIFEPASRTHRVGADLGVAFRW